MNKSKHIFTGIIVVVLVSLAVGLWAAVHHARINTFNPSQINGFGSKRMYTHSDSSFSFVYPEDLRASSSWETDAEGKQFQRLVFRGNSEARTFYIKVSPFDAFTTLTLEQIKQDLPSLLVEDPEAVSVGGARGVAFISGDSDSPVRTREIWFSYGGKLYQISTFKEFDTQIVDILSTWKFGF